MRTIKIKTLIAMLLLLPMGMIQAQMDGESQAFWVHEDHVKPSMVDEYEKVSKDLIANLKKHNIQDEAWITSQTDDLRYLYVGPIENMADLDRQMFSSLAEKMGAEAMGNLFNEMDQYYDKHFNYVIHLDKELSYMPGGITQTPEGQDYRKFYYLHTTPANRAKLAEKMKAVKKLYEDKGSSVNYRVYQSGFGAPNDFFMVAIAAKDALSYEQQAADNRALMGESAKPVFDAVMEYVTKFEVIPGQMRPDLAYSPQ